MRDQDKSPGSAVCEDCIHMFADISAVTNGSSDSKYYERDNMGTRQDNMGQATSYWMIERMQSAVKPQFTLFTMPSYAAGEKAFLSLPFFHKAEEWTSTGMTGWHSCSCGSFTAFCRRRPRTGRAKFCA